MGGLIRCAGRPREWSCGAVPPQERWHEGGWFLFFLWRLLRCRRGILSHAKEWSGTHAATGVTARGVRGWGVYPLRGAGAGAPIRRRHIAGATRPRPAAGQARINALFVFLVLWGGAVAVCFEGCCGGMCWPRERPATHAAAGAAARGALIFCFGGGFHTLRSGWHERVRGGGFNPLRGATMGVVMRRRHAAGATRPRPAAGQARINALFVFWFCGGCCCRLF